MTVGLNRRVRRPLGACIVLIAAASSALADAPRYRLVFLGAASDVEGMNAAGEVVGGFSPPLTGEMRAYVAGPGHPYELLPLPNGYARSWANGINDAGTIVGAASINGYPNEHGDAVVWTPDGRGGYGVEVLGHLPGHTGSVAKAINNRGDIVGQSIFSNSGFGPAVWFNAPGGLLDLSLLGAPSRVEAINDEGTLVGFNGTLFDLDTLEALPLPPGQLGLTALYAINNRGELAGGYGTGNLACAVRWTHAFGWENVGRVGGRSAQLWAYDINADGVTVAEALDAENRWRVVVHFDQLGTLPLASLIVPGHEDWRLVPTLGGQAIDDAGRIAVIASNATTQDYGVALLIPIRTTGDLNCDGATDAFDIEPFVLAISDPNGYAARYPNCDVRNADINGDGVVDAFDIEPFVELLTP